MASGQASAQSLESTDDAIPANMIAGVAEIRMMDDGSLELVLVNGEVVVISSDQFEMRDGVPYVTLDGLADFSAAARAIAPLEDVSGIGGETGILLALLGVGAVGGVIVAASGGGDDVDPVVVDPNVATPLSDNLTGTPGDDTIDALAGDDTVDGLAGNDTLIGNDGDDTLIGSAGNDILDGGAGSDNLSGGEGDDFLQGGGGSDINDGGAGIDTASFENIGAPVTVAFDEEGNGTAVYSPAPDVTVTDELISIENFVGTVNEANADTLDLSNFVADADDASVGVRVDLDTNTPNPGPVSQDGVVQVNGETVSEVTDFENIIGTAGNDVLLGNQEINDIQGGAGDDSIHTFGGADTADGGEGVDTLLLSATPVGTVLDLDDNGDGTVFINGNAADVVTNFENISGSNVGDDTLSGNSGANVLNGNGGNDTLIGEGGNDTLNGGDGDDVLAGGGGTDTIDGGEGIDTNSFEGIGLGVTASIADGTASYGMVSETFQNIENLTGSDNNDSLTGDDGVNVLAGGMGNDTITGGLGDDIIDGGEGFDTADFSDIDVPVTVVLDENGNGTATRETGFSVTVTDVPVDALTGISDADFVSEAVAGNLYVNVHTSDFPGGEVRGQLLVDSDMTDEAGVRTITLSGPVDAAQEPGPLSDSLATGTISAVIVVDAEGNATYSSELSLTGLASSDLQTPAPGVLSAIHLHNAPAGENGPVVQDTLVDAGGTLDAGTATGVTQDVIDEVVETDTLTSIEDVILSDDNDSLVATGSNANIVDAGAGDDFVSTGGGDDILLGGAGDDVLAGGGGTDTIDGGDGIDTNSFEGIGLGVTASIADGTATYGMVSETFVNIENLTGSDNDDSLTGDMNDNVLTGGLGNDILDGGEGIDTADFSDVDVPVTVVLDENGDGTATRETGFGITFEDVAVDSLNVEAIADDAAFVTEALDGNLYFNVHTNDFNGGEIRGQLDTLVSDETVDGVRTIVLSASLDASQEPGPTSDSEATGEALVTITVDADGNASYSVDLDITGLATSDLLPVAGFSAIHLHNAPAGQNGPVILDIVQDAGGDITGATTDGDVFAEVTETDTLISIENVILSDDGDSFTATGSLSNSVEAGAGNDTIITAGGSDTIFAGAGDDFVQAGGGSDFTDGGEGFDTVSFADLGVGVGVSLADESAVYVVNGNEIIDSVVNFEDVIGTDFDDIIEGNFEENIIEALDGDDVILAGGGDDIIFAGAGDDLVQGGGGNDSADGGEGIDTLSFEDIGVGVNADLVEGVAQYVVGENVVVDEFIDFENVIGSLNNDQINGDSEDNVIEGLAGDDLLSGGGGDDAISAGEGNDTILAGNGNDELFGDEGDDLLDGDIGDDFLQGGLGNDTLNGGAGFDTADFSDLDVPVVVTLDENGNGTAVRETGFSVTVENAQVTNDEAFVEQALANELYVNVHTADFPGGEVRGQLIVDTVVNQNGITTITLSGPVDASQEPGPTSDSLATGTISAVIVVDADGNATYSSELTVSGLAPSDLLTPGPGGVSAIHLHNAPVGQNGPIVQDILVDAGGTLDAASPTGVTEDVIDEVVETDTLISIENVILSDDFDDLTVLGDLSVEVETGDGEDVIITGDGDDVITASSGDNIIITEGGEDIIFTGTGEDGVDAGAGDDAVIASAGNDSLLGGVGNDTVVFDAVDAGVAVSLVAGESTFDLGGEEVVTLLSEFENVIGSTNNDQITGDGNDNLLEGLAGSDVLSGLSGDDILEGSEGSDILGGGSGDDVLRGGDDNDALNGDADDDILQGGLGDDRLDGGEGIDTADFSDLDVEVLVDVDESGNGTATRMVDGELETDTLVSIENFVGENIVLVNDPSSSMMLTAQGAVAEPADAASNSVFADLSQGMFSEPSTNPITTTLQSDPVSFGFEDASDVGAAAAIAASDMHEVA